MWLLLSACTPAVLEPAFPAPDAWEVAGPGLGGPSSAPVGERCAALTGGPEDIEHHNHVVFWNGYLVMPWAPEDGGGGLTVFDVSDPCNPVKVGEAFDPRMRESHTLPIQTVGDRVFAAVDYHELVDGEPVGGVGFWELTDPTAPRWVSQLAVPGYYYPDAYVRVTLSTFWQGDVVYASGGQNGVYLIDAADPTAPALLSTWSSEVPFVVGSFHVLGNVAVAASAGVARNVFVDLSDPRDPQEVRVLDTVDDQGERQLTYFSSIGGRYLLLARKNAGGGPIVYDLTDPLDPVWTGQFHSPDGDGGYVFRQKGFLFQGESDFGAVYDFADPTAMGEVLRVELAGDLDTITPLGSHMVVAVDDDAEPGLASVMVPWTDAPDDIPPKIELTVPAADALNQPTSTRIGLSLDAFVQPDSAHAGSVQVWTSEGDAIPGTFRVQENLVNFTPDAPLPEGVTVHVRVPAGGLTDWSGNAVAEGLEFRFATGPELL